MSFRSSEVPKIFNLSLFLNANLMAKSDYMMGVILSQLEQIRYLILDMILMNQRIWTIPIVHTQYIDIDISRDVLPSPEAQ